MMMLIPEAWEKNKLQNKDLKSYYNYNSNLIEPWDGPAAMCFTDGKKIGAILDRNGFVHPDIWLLMMVWLYFI